MIKENTYIPFTGSLRDRMAAIGLTAKKLAARLGRSSVCVGHWLNGQFLPTGSIRPNLAAALQISPAQLEDLIAGRPVDLPPVVTAPPSTPVAAA